MSPEHAVAALTDVAKIVQMSSTKANHKRANAMTVE